MTEDEKRELKQALIANSLAATEDLAFLVEKAERLGDAVKRTADELNTIGGILKTQPDQMTGTDLLLPIGLVGQACSVATEIRKQKAVVRDLDGRKRSLGISSP